MISQEIIDLLGLKPIDNPFSETHYSWENELGVCRVMTCDINGRPFEDDRFLVLASDNISTAWVITFPEFVIDQGPEIIIGELKHGLYRHKKYNQ